MNILVTGSKGQLGTHIGLLADGSQHRYFFTDVDELDICRRDAVFNYVLTNDINVVINCAAYTNVDKAEDNEADAELVNATAVRHLADAMKVSGGMLVHVSTDYVFGGAGYNRPIRENDNVNPTGAYGRTKLHGEQAIAEVGCRSVIIRTAWLYSEYGNNFVKTMLRLFAERESLNVVFDQVGTPTYAGDLAHLIFTIVENENLRNLEGVYHFTNEGVCSWFDFSYEIARQAGMTGCKIKPCMSKDFPSKVVRPPYSVLDKSKVKETFGLDIPHWSESLSHCLTHLLHK
ncbi:MAG: dTDP-4-dehydrorhamnose reductase [Bacteroidales bacterium]|nr:dTDP-4-dehydrorhamnose reductase [Bacteroidales bacterium]